MGELAAWLPHGVLATLFVGTCAVLWRMASHVVQGILDGLQQIETTVENISKELGKFATLDQLGRMGDRFDMRLSEVNKEIGAMRDRLTRVEARQENDDDDR